MRFIIFITACVLCFATGVHGQPDAKKNQATLRVTVESLRNDKGLLHLSLFKTDKGFPGDSKQAFKTLSVPIKKDKNILIFEKVPFGDYAISVLHDENKNNKMDTNWLGIPREGGGASNNPKPRMGPPRFSESKFTVNSPTLNMRIRMVYP